MIYDKRFIGLIIIVGFIAGLVGASYTHLLHGIQHFVYITPLLIILCLVQLWPEYHR